MQITEVGSKWLRIMTDLDSLQTKLKAGGATDLSQAGRAVPPMKRTVAAPLESADQIDVKVRRTSAVLPAFSVRFPGFVCPHSHNWLGCIECFTCCFARVLLVSGSFFRVG